MNKNEPIPGEIMFLSLIDPLGAAQRTINFDWLEKVAGCTPYGPLAGIGPDSGSNWGPKQTNKRNCKNTQKS